MRQKLKIVLFAALSAALAVAGLSIAAGNGGSGSSSDSRSGWEGMRHQGPPGGQRFHMRIDSDVGDVMRQIHDAVEKKAPEIAAPVIQKAEAAGDITSAQADRLRAAAQAIADGKRPDGDLRSLLRDADVRKVVRDAFAAAHEQAPSIGEPIVQKALDEKKVTEAQANDIRDRLKSPPPFGRGPGFGPGHRHGGPPGLGRRIDSDVAAVLDDVHRAVEQKEEQIAGPILTKAVEDGTISQDQADAIRSHRPPASFDADVASVLRKVHQAVAEQVPGIAAPIVGKAQSDGKITKAQANRIETMLRDAPRLGGGPPPMGGPGPGGHHWGGRSPSQGGNAPGAYPGGAAPGALPAVAAGQPA